MPLPRFTQISAGWKFSLFTRSDGSLWVVSDNTYGQLGEGYALTETNIPQQLLASNVAAISAGPNHSLFIKSDGSLLGHGL